MDNTQSEHADRRLAPVAGYVAALENALYAAIVTLYSAHKEDCVNTFSFDELSMVVDKTRTHLREGPAPSTYDQVQELSGGK